MAFDLVVTDRGTRAQIDQLVPDVQEALKRALAPLASSIAADAQNRAQAHIRYLGVAPGKYVASIYGGLSATGDRVLGYVRSSSPLAHLLEYGAQTPPHVIQASVASVLKFAGSAGEVFAARVNHPGATIPAYPAIGPAVDARQGDIMGTLEAALKDTVRKVF